MSAKSNNDSCVCLINRGFAVVNFVFYIFENWVREKNDFILVCGN